jgi:hypothetical protein
VAVVVVQVQVQQRRASCHFSVSDLSWEWDRIAFGMKCLLWAKV